MSPPLLTFSTGVLPTPAVPLVAFVLFGLPIAGLGRRPRLRVIVSLSLGLVAFSSVLAISLRLVLPLVLSLVELKLDLLVDVLDC